jgi:hypothetical protein
MSLKFLILFVAGALGLGGGLAVGLAWGTRLSGAPGPVEQPPAKVENAAPVQAPARAGHNKGDSPVRPLADPPLVPTQTRGRVAQPRQLVAVYKTREEADAAVKSWQSRGVHADIVIDSGSSGTGEIWYCVFTGKKGPDGPHTIRPSH